MEFRRIGGEKDGVAMLHHDFAVGAYRQRAGGFRLDMQERVRAEMLGDADGRLPVA
jgi:hypothetical protein